LGDATFCRSTEAAAGFVLRRAGLAVEKENGQAVETLGRARILFLHVRNPLFEESILK
jgi:hypothetical protein